MTVMVTNGLKLEQFTMEEGLILFNVRDLQGLLLAVELSMDQLYEQFPEMYQSLDG